MLPIHTAPVSVASETASRGQILARRNHTSPWVSFLESGRVVLGVMAGDVMEHQLGVLEGPCWLEASSAVLDLPPAVDAVADTDVELRRVPGAEFRRILADLSGPARAGLDDGAPPQPPKCSSPPGARARSFVARGPIFPTTRSAA